MRKLIVTAAFVIVAALAVVSVAVATPPSGVSVQTLGDTTFWGRTRIITRVITIQPGGTSGWHAWQGAVVKVTVLSGTASVYLSNCVRRQEPAGATYVERLGERNVVRNETTTQPVVLLARFVLPAGAVPVRIDLPAPAGCAVA
jgi:quercetin dioxygenase-like cupin family protein